MHMKKKKILHDTFYKTFIKSYTFLCWGIFENLLLNEQAKLL